MKLLMNKTQWKKWLVDDLSIRKKDVSEGMYDPPSFPVYGYSTVSSFNYEELSPLYLTADQVGAMAVEIYSASKSRKGA